MTDHQGAGHARIDISASGTPSVRRGASSWEFIYIALGFWLAIIGTFIQMLPLDLLGGPAPRANGAVLYAAVVFLSIWSVQIGTVQNALVRLKGKIEDKFR